MPIFFAVSLLTSSVMVCKLQYVSNVLRVSSYKVGLHLVSDLTYHECY